MDDGVDNGMIIYIILTEQIIAAEFFIEKFNYISSHFKPLPKKALKFS